MSAQGVFSRTGQVTLNLMSGETGVLDLGTDTTSGNHLSTTTQDTTEIIYRNAFKIFKPRSTAFVLYSGQPDLESPLGSERTIWKGRGVVSEYWG